MTDIVAVFSVLFVVVISLFVILMIPTAIFGYFSEKNFIDKHKNISVVKLDKYGIKLMFSDGSTSHLEDFYACSENAVGMKYIKRCGDNGKFKVGNKVYTNESLVSYEVFKYKGEQVDLYYFKKDEDFMQLKYQIFDSEYLKSFNEHSIKASKCANELNSNKKLFWKEVFRLI